MHFGITGLELDRYFSQWWWYCDIFSRSSYSSVHVIIDRLLIVFSLVALMMFTFVIFKFTVGNFSMYFVHVGD